MKHLRFALLGLVTLAALVVDSPPATASPGTPTFASAITIPVGVKPAKGQIADLDADGRLDIVVPDNSDGRVYVLLGDGAGGFSQTVLPALGPGGWSVDIADFNNDGRLDLAVLVSAGGPPSSSVYFFEGDGSGGFSPVPVVTLSQPGTQSFQVRAADLNADGRADVVTSLNTSDEVRTYLATGDFNFGASTDCVLPLRFPHDFAILDVHQPPDGNPDVALVANGGSHTDGGIIVLPGSPTGPTCTPTWTPTSSPSPPPGGTANGPVSLDVEDYDGVMGLDIIVGFSRTLGNPSADAFKVALGDGAGSFPVVNSFPTPQEAWSIASHDWTGDGNLDLVLPGLADDEMNLYPGQGDGTFLSSLLTLPTGAGPLWVADADFNEDNLQDIVASNLNGGTLQVYLQNNSPVGINVTASLNGGLATVGGIEVTFSSVTVAGLTTVGDCTACPPPPTGFKIVGTPGQPLYFDIDTTATYSGSVMICIKYDDSQLSLPESQLKLMHHDGTGFVNVTTSIDMANNVICGSTSTLSPLAVMGDPFDDDGDGYWDADETAKASDPLDVASTPEHCDGEDNDGDTVVDEAPAGANWDIDGDTVKDCLDGSVDTDGDGLVNTLDADDDMDGRTDAQERRLSTDELGACPTGVSHDGWASDRDRDKDADVGDVIQSFGMGKIGNPANYDARSDADMDGDDDIGDVIQLYGTGKIGTRCAILTYTNNTGGPVDDIHVEWSAPIAEVWVARDSELAGWSSRLISGGGMVLDIERPDGSGDLAAGGTLTLVVRTGSMMGSVTACRWTLEGVDVGAC